MNHCCSIVTAVDGDRGINNPIHYSISSNNLAQEADLFRVQRNSGIVLTANNLDRETLSSTSGAYILQITVSDLDYTYNTGMINFSL